MDTGISRAGRALLVLCAVVGVRELPAQEHVEPVSLSRVRIRDAIRGPVLGGNVTLVTARTAEVDALERLGQAEVRVLGYVFDRPMPNTYPLYRLSRKAAGGSSPEWYYTTNRAEADALVGKGWRDDGILCYVPRDGARALYHLSSAGAHFYTSDVTERQRYRAAGYVDEGSGARLLGDTWGWNADTFLFGDSRPTGAGPRPESYSLVCRRTKGAWFGRDGVYFKFARASRRASGELAAGECAWPDRRMSDDEPDVLLAPHANHFSFVAPAHRDEPFWTFQVYNDGRGRMIVTGAEPGRPPEQGQSGIPVTGEVKGPAGTRPEIGRVPPVRPPAPPRPPRP